MKCCWTSFWRAGHVGVQHVAEPEDAWIMHSGHGRVARPLLDLLAPGLAPFWSFSSDGTTVARSWKMIEAEMYGMTPSPKIVLCDRLPPENSDT
jgi:hypothetical protein